MYPSKVNKMFNQNAPRKPTCKNTPSGGRRIAISTLIMSIVDSLMYRMKQKLSLVAAPRSRIETLAKRVPKPTLRVSSLSYASEARGDRDVQAVGRSVLQKNTSVAAVFARFELGAPVRSREFGVFRSR